MRFAQAALRSPVLGQPQFVGAVVELARKAGIATPIIAAIGALICECAKHVDR